MHSHFVAHLDVGFADILLNFGGLRGRYEWFMGLREPMAFRSRLSAPCRYTFIDFEVGAIFPYGSNPTTHTSFGVHFTKTGRLAGFNSYAKVSFISGLRSGRNFQLIHFYSLCRLNGKE